MSSSATMIASQGDCLPPCLCSFRGLKVLYTPSTSRYPIIFLFCCALLSLTLLTHFILPLLLLLLDQRFTRWKILLACWLATHFSLAYPYALRIPQHPVVEYPVDLPRFTLISKRPCSASRWTRALRVQIAGCATKLHFNVYNKKASHVNRETRP